MGALRFWNGFELGGAMIALYSEVDAGTLVDVSTYY